MKLKKLSAPQLTSKNLREYQWKLFRFIIENPHVALLVDMGLGKSISVLSAIKHLFHKGELTKPVLVIAPIRVIYSVWRQEAIKWKHTESLTFSLVHGGAKQRMEALSRPAHIYLINPEGVAWLIAYYMRLSRHKLEVFNRKWPFQMLVVDESTFFKQHTTQRFKALRKALPLFERRVIMTGTPTPNSLLQLWAQMFIVDMGEALLPTFTDFRDRFFEKQDYMGYNFKLRDGAKSEINKRLRNTTIRLQDSDWLQLPPLVKQHVKVSLPTRAMDMYEKFEKEMFLELESAEVEALSAASLTQRCQQIANGAIYALDKETSAKDWHVVHDAKIDALKELLDELGEARCIISYTFKHDLARLQALLPEVPVMGPKNTEQLVQEWMAGKHQYVFIHPQSGSHGVNNLQVNCRRVVFFSVPWSGEHHDQLVARVGPARRNGEKEPTIVHYLVAQKTIDEAIAAALERKAAGQADLLNALKDYREEKESGALGRLT